jgi:hypothetical protein
MPETITRLRVSHTSAAADELLAPNARPRLDELDAQRLMLRQHLRLLAVAVEDAARRRPDDSEPHAAALDECAAALALLGAEPGRGLRPALAHLRVLARQMRALCDRYGALTGARLPAVAA